MALDQDIFISDMLRAYLRKLKYQKGLALSGAFSHQDALFAWGAVGEYGLPPEGSFVLEISPNGSEWASFRFWHARQRDEETVYRGKSVMFEEICKNQNEPFHRKN